MPDTHHGQEQLQPPSSEAADALAGDAALVDAPIARLEHQAGEPVLESEAVEAGSAEALDAQAVEAPVAGDDSAKPGEGPGEDAGETARPSFSGKVAKPHKAKAPKAKKPKKAKKPRDPRRLRHVLMGLVIAVLVALLVGTGLFCWQKWMRFDDTADIQGVWKVQATGDTIVFDGRDLKLTRGISYEYRLNTDEKTITYRFGDLAGGGVYYFSADRQMLVIVDGDERLGVLAELGFLPESVLREDDANDNKTVLSKVSGDTSAEPSGTATGVSVGAATGEREYVVKPEPSSSSSSEKKTSKSSRSEQEGDAAENRGFVDEDGDGYDDETDLAYEDFMLSRAQGSFTDEDEDGYDDLTGLEYDEFLQAYGLNAYDGQDDGWADEGEGADDADAEIEYDYDQDEFDDE